MPASGTSASITSNPCWTGWTNDRGNTHARRRTRIPPPSGEALACADATPSDCGMVDAERLRAGPWSRVQASRGKPAVERRHRLQGPRHRGQSQTRLQLELDGPRDSRDLHAHTHEERRAAAHGTIGLPSGSAAELSGRQIRMAEIFWKSGTGADAGGLKPARAVRTVDLLKSKRT